MAKKPTDNPEFDAFWSLYPRCIDKQGTIRAYKAAIKRGYTHEQIMNGLREYRFGPEPLFIPHSTTWLNRDRFVAEIIRVPPTVVVQQPKPSRASWRNAAMAVMPDVRSLQKIIDGVAEPGPDLFHQTDNRARGK